MMEYIVGTRGSRLAIAQCELVIEQLQKAYPQHTYHMKIIQTTGDKNQQQALYQMNDKGVFVKELEQALYNHEIDIATHSMKDMPVTLCEGLQLAKTILREDARDVFISHRYTSIHELPPQAVIGTGSLRRRMQLHEWRQDLQFVNIRGNIDTRIQKMKYEGLDGIILAAAAMHRLHLQHMICDYLSEDIMVPAPAQGALAIELRVQDHTLNEMLTTLCNDTLHKEIMIERNFLAAMDAGCHAAIGASCKIDHDQMHFICMAGDDHNVSSARYQYDGIYDPSQVSLAADFLKAKSKGI